MPYDVPAKSAFSLRVALNPYIFTSLTLLFSLVHFTDIANASQLLCGCFFFFQLILQLNEFTFSPFACILMGVHSKIGTPMVWAALVGSGDILVGSVPASFGHLAVKSSVGDHSDCIGLTV